MNNHRRLKIWHVAGDLIVDCYGLADTLPTRERYVAVPQLLRAAWSVQNNIAEGNARLGNAERRRFFGMALSSLAEIDSMLGTLGRLYELNPERVHGIEERRRVITAAIFRILRGPRR